MSRIEVTAEELRTVSGQLQHAATAIQDENSRAMSQVQGLVGAGWSGAASDSFHQLFQQWKQGADQVQDALHGISQQLSGAGDAYQQTEDAIKASMQ